MSRAEKASEPSMEEILASIRKIISEDPAGLSGVHGGAQGSGQANANIKAVAVKPEIVAAQEARAPGLLSSLGHVSPAAPSIDQSSRGSQAVSMQPAPAAARNVPGAAVQAAKPSAADLDDILGLADGAGAPSTPAPAPASPTLQQSASNAPGAAAAVLPAALSRPMPTATERAPVQPFFPPQSRDLPPFGNAFPAGPGPAASATDFRAVVPGRADGGRPDMSRAESGRVVESEAGAPRFSDIRPDNPLAERGGTGSGPVVRVPIAASPAPSPAPIGTGLMGTGLNGTGFSGSKAQPIVPGAASKPNEPVAEKASMPVAAEIAKPAVETAPKVVAETKIEPPKAEPPKPGAPKSDTPITDAPKAELAKPAAIAVASVSAATTVAPAALPADAIQSTVTAVASPYPASAAEPTRTMEDTVAELLRPMLRQWLDTNMPRVVEKALRVELAASAKPKTDPSKP